MKPWILSFSLIFLLALTTWAQTTGTLSYGETVTGNITNDDPVHHWSFEGSAGDVVNITMTATNLAEGNLDSYLILLDAEEQVLAENDDASNITIDAAIENFALPADGLYTIQASRFGFESGLVTGEYELTLALAEDEDTPSEENPIEGQTLTGTLNRSNFEDNWTIEGVEGELISIRMKRNTGDLDTYLRLLDENSRELASNDDSEDSTTVSEILNFEFPYSGSYTIVATRFGFESGTSSGDYTLTISGEATEPTPESTPESATPEPTPAPTQTENPPPTQTPAPLPTQSATPELGLPPSFVPISYGAFVRAELSTGDEIDFYQFAGQAGDVVTISLKRVSGDLNPALTLLNAENEILNLNQDFNGPADARISGYVLPATGTYAISALAENQQAGAYILHLFVSGKSELPAPQAEAIPAVVISDAELAFILAWSGPADFDLAVIAPNGERIDFASNGSGGLFGGDANGGCTETQANPSETVYWESTAPPGNYQIEIAHVFPCGAEGAVSFTLSVQKGGQVLQTFSGELRQGSLETYEISLD